jgi:hypothetical protein
MALGAVTGANIRVTVTGRQCALPSPAIPLGPRRVLGPTGCCQRFGCLDYAYVVLLSRTEIGDPKGLL